MATIPSLALAISAGSNAARSAGRTGSELDANAGTTTAEATAAVSNGAWRRTIDLRRASYSRAPADPRGDGRSRHGACAVHFPGASPMTKTEDGGLILSASEVDAVLLLLLAEQLRVVDIHATTFSAINSFVAEWERVNGPLPDLVR
jgi:hypothetical protein